jgi:hypothetical protein
MLPGTKKSIAILEAGPIIEEDSSLDLYRDGGAP